MTARAPLLRDHVRFRRPSGMRNGYAVEGEIADFAYDRPREDPESFVRIAFVRVTRDAGLYRDGDLVKVIVSELEPAGVTS